MDWIEEQIKKWKLKFKNFSLRKAMMVYLVSAIFLVMLAGTVTISFCTGWRNLILATNTMNDSYQYIGDGIFAQKKITSQDDAFFWKETDVVTVGKKHQRQKLASGGRDSADCGRAGDTGEKAGVKGIENCAGNRADFVLL